MYSVERRVRKWYDRSVDGMEYEDSFVVYDQSNGKEIAEVDSLERALQVARKLNGVSHDNE